MINNNIRFTTLKDNPEYLWEYVKLCKLEWSNYIGEELEIKIEKQVKRIIANQDDVIFVILMLVNDELIGFISLFEKDGDYHQELGPWVSTFYIKENYRKMGYSVELFEKVLQMSRKIGYDKVFFRSYYEEYYNRFFEAEIIDNLENGQKLFKMNLK